MIKTPADLAHHVLLEFETVRNGRPWNDGTLGCAREESAT